MWIDHALVVAAVLLWTGSGFAAEPNCQSDPECRRLSLEGRTAHKDRKDFLTAIEQFQAAYRRVQDPRLLMMLGRSVYKLGDVAHSIELYNQALPHLQSPDQEKLRRFIEESVAALHASARPAGPAPILPRAQDTNTSTVSLAYRPSLRLGLGLGFAVLSTGALVTAIAASSIHGHEGPSGSCQPIGTVSGCAYDLTPVIAVSYAAAGVFAVSTAITFAWPSRSKAEQILPRGALADPGHPHEVRDPRL